MATKESPQKKPAKKTAAKKKTPGRTTARRKASGRKKPVKGKASFLNRMSRYILTILLFIVVSMGAGAGYYLFKHSGSSTPEVTRTAVKSPVTEKKPAAASAREKTPEFEVFKQVPQPKPRPVPPVLPPKGPDDRPQVAIIIDDMGYDWKLAEKFLSLEAPFTYAILPHSPYRREIANAARLKGYDVMLHLPMEPNEYPEIDPGPGALLSSMTPDERIAILKQNLESVPFISGVNNHMGSKMTANSEHMNQVLSILKKRGLFYIDSLTTHDSKSASSARLFQVPFARRDVFLDHDPAPAAIRKELERLIRAAELNGYAIGIGHPYETTYAVLAESLPMLNQRVHLIPASEAVRLAGY